MLVAQGGQAFEGRGVLARAIVLIRYIPWKSRNRQRDSTYLKPRRRGGRTKSLVQPFRSHRYYPGLLSLQIRLDIVQGGWRFAIPVVESEPVWILRPAPNPSRGFPQFDPAWSISREKGSWKMDGRQSKQFHCLMK